MEKGMISVIMGAYNCEDSIGTAIESVVGQTYPDWELLICDDGSSDRTAAVIDSWSSRYPGKIRKLSNPANRGLCHALNRCLEEARGEYIARMDADDTCRPQRLQKELDVLTAEPEIAIVSTDIACYDESGVWGRISHPEYPECSDIARDTPFCHAPCLVRRAAFAAVGGYSEDPRCMRVEDYDLWLRMYAAGFRGKNIHEPLYEVREDRETYRRRRFGHRVNETRVRARAVRELGLPGRMYIYSLKPVILGLIPPFLYRYLHRRNLRG